MTREQHLTEDERHELADGSLDAAQLATASKHLEACTECSADVDRIRRLMKLTGKAVSRESASSAGIDEMWPSIRERIEERKVVALGGPGREGERAGGRAGERARGRESPSQARGKLRVGGRGWMFAAGVVAAGVLGFWATRGGGAPGESTSVTGTDSGIALISVVDSTHAYQEEAQALLNHLELERATMRPELSRALDRDLRTIDVAIAELQDAIRNDPRNPALRRLLASSFRQKVDLLKRVDNAG
jgi:anti-sigma factor RsiW